MGETMGLKQAIERELELAWKNGRNAGSSGALPTMEQVVDSGTEQLLRTVVKHIAAFSEALLSEAAIEAAARYMYVDGGNQGVWEEERETYQNRYRGRAETTLEVALAAITGGWKDGFKANE